MKTTVYLAELKKDQVKAGGETFEVSLGWYYKGQFPSEGSLMPEFDTLALFYITEDESGKEKIVAVDAVYHDKDGFKSARLFGKPDEVVPLSGKSQITSWFEQLPLPRRRIRINVVNHESEQLFESGGVMFDLLNARDEFENGQLSIIRDRDVLDRTESIHEVGTHAACTCFCGLKKFFGENDSRSWAISALAPEDFQVGDVLFLDVLAFPNFDFIGFLRQRACLLSATLQAFKEKSEMNLGELRERVAQEVVTTAEGFASATVVRFRERRK